MLDVSHRGRTNSQIQIAAQVAIKAWMACEVSLRSCYMAQVASDTKRANAAHTGARTLLTKSALLEISSHKSAALQRSV